MKQAETCEAVIESLEKGLGEKLIYAFIQLSVGQKKAEEKYKSLKYTIAELEEIEEMIDKQYPVGHKPLSTTLIPFGFYLGEVLKKSIEKSHWVIKPDKNNPEDLFEATIKCNSMIAYPFRRVNKFWHDRSDKMSSLVRMISFTTEVSLDPDYWKHRANEDGWIHLINGEMIRMFIAEPGDTEFKNAKGFFHDKKPDGTKN